MTDETPGTPLTRHEAHEIDHVTRGRDLTDSEMSCYLADHSGAIRHGRARVGDEIAEQLRDRLAAFPGAWTGWTPPWVERRERVDPDPAVQAVVKAATELIEHGEWTAGQNAYWLQTMGEGKALYIALREAVEALDA